MTSLSKLFFIGAGQMATAIAGGMVKHGFIASAIHAIDCNPAAAKNFTQTTTVECSTELSETVLKSAAVVVIAVKPQYLEAALKDKKDMLANKLIISIVAGAPIAKLKALTQSERVVRVMPNTPALLGLGCGAYAVSERVTSVERNLVEKILSAIGEFGEVNEHMLDAVTALSGCGPAYVFDLIQAMADGGTTLGLPRDMALKLAAATVRGAAEMVLQREAHPIALRDRVCSPGGATICGVNVLERRGFRSAVIDAEIAAFERSRDLGKYGA